MQVCVLDETGKVLMNRKYRDDWKVIRSAVSRFGNVVHAGIEACNGAANLADQLVDKAGWCVSLAHPGYVARIKQSPDKTDWADARLIGDLVRVGYLPKVWLAPERIRELRRLVRYRQQIASLRRNTKLRIRALLRDHRIKISDFNPWTKAWLQAVANSTQLTGISHWIMKEHLADLQRTEARIKYVENKIKEQISNDKLALELMTQPGIGLVTAATMRAEIGRFDRFKNGKQLSRFCGLSPRNASSGQRQADAGIIKAGNPEMRRVLTQAAHRLMRNEPRWINLATRLLSQGKPTPLVVAAVSNRWIRRLYHQMKPLGLGYESLN